MTKNPQYRLEDTELNYVFISNYYDLPLSGLCRHQGKLCRFSIDKDWGGEEPVFYDVFELSFFERLKARYNKKLFELCVGYHWSFKDKKREGSFYVRSPQWFYKWLFNIYFKIPKSTKIL